MSVWRRWMDSRGCTAAGAGGRDVCYGHRWCEDGLLAGVTLLLVYGPFLPPATQPPQKTATLAKLKWPCTILVHCRGPISWCRRTQVASSSYINCSFNSFRAVVVFFPGKGPNGWSNLLTMITQWWQIVRSMQRGRQRNIYLTPICHLNTRVYSWLLNIATLALFSAGYIVTIFRCVGYMRHMTTSSKYQYMVVIRVGYTNFFTQPSIWSPPTFGY